MDKVTQILVEALKQAAAGPGEQRLFKSGKLAGLFPGKTGPNADAAAQALREGLLETVRTETKGKTTTQWVRLTPRGVEFLHAHESPVRALHDLRAALQMTREGVPVWLLDIRRQVEAVSARLTEEVQQIARRLEALGQCVSDVLERAEGRLTATPQAAAAVVPWGGDALTYLDRRCESGLANGCPLPELFAALRDKHAGLPVKDFHTGLRRLHDRGLLRLLPVEESTALPEPEYALVDGAAVYYRVEH
jgi:hypothetical protein